MYFLRSTNRNKLALKQKEHSQTHGNSTQYHHHHKKKPLHTQQNCTPIRSVHSDSSMYSRQFPSALSSVDWKYDTRLHSNWLFCLKGHRRAGQTTQRRMREEENKYSMGIFVFFCSVFDFVGILFFYTIKVKVRNRSQARTRIHTRILIERWMDG